MTSITPYYQDDAVTIYHGDCREIVPTLGKFELLLADPPYGINYSHGKDTGRWKTKFSGIRIIGDNEPIDLSFLIELDIPSIIWGGNYFADKLPLSRSWIVWDKRSGSHHTNDFADCEIAWSNLGIVARMFRHQWDGFRKASEVNIKRQHPTQKPIMLMKWCINLAGDVQTILDPFAGSGTTGRAAKDLGKKAVLIEIEEKYCEIAARRMGQEVLL